MAPFQNYGIRPSSLAYQNMSHPATTRVGAIGEGINSGLQALMNALQFNSEQAYRRGQLGNEGRRLDIEAGDAATRAAVAATGKTHDYFEAISQGMDPEQARRAYGIGSSIGAQPQQAGGAQPSSPGGFNAGASVNTDTGTAMEALANANAMPQSGIDSRTSDGGDVGKTQAQLFDPTRTAQYQTENLRETGENTRAADDLGERKTYHAGELANEKERNRLTAENTSALREQNFDFRRESATDAAQRGANTAAPVAAATKSANAVTRFDQAYAGAKRGDTGDLAPAIMSAMQDVDNVGAIRSFMLKHGGQDPSVKENVSQWVNTMAGHPQNVHFLDEMHDLVHSIHGASQENANRFLAQDSASHPIVNPGMWGAVRSQYQLPGSQDTQGPLQVSQQEMDAIKRNNPQMTDTDLSQHYRVQGAGSPGGNTSTPSQPQAPQTPTAATVPGSRYPIPFKPVQSSVSPTVLPIPQLQPQLQQGPQ